VALKLTDAVIRRIVVNFTEEQRDWALEHFGVRDWPEQFLRRVADVRDSVPPSTEAWWGTMREIHRQICVRQMHA
jgi:hypothetical protein